MQGCIAEQRIAHTCGNHTLDNVISQREQMHMAADMQQQHVHHSHNVPHRPHVHSHPHPQEYSGHQIKHLGDYPPQEGEYPRGSDYPHTSEYPQTSDYTHTSEYPPVNEYVRSSEYQDSGQDTRERRGLMMTTHQEDQSKSNQSGLGSNTWPRKRIRVRNTANISTFFHVFDEDTSGSRMSIDDNSYACSRVLRGEGGHPDNLPPGTLS